MEYATEIRSTMEAFRRSYRPPRRTPPVMPPWLVMPVCGRRLTSAASNFWVFCGDCAETAPDNTDSPSKTRVNTRLIAPPPSNTMGYRDDELDTEKVHSVGVEGGTWYLVLSAWCLVRRLSLVLTAFVDCE